MQLVKAPMSMLPKCGSCGLYKTCKSPKMPVTGQGRKKILVVAEAPGKDEDEHGIQLVGVTGQMFEDTLNKFDVDLRRDCWLTNALICRPPGNEIKTDEWIDYCRPNLIKTVEDLKPEVIILLGGTPVYSLLGWLWKEDPEGISRWAGFQIPSQRINAWVCPTFHPSYVMRSGKDRGEKTNPLVRMFYEKHLKAACKLKGRPWPDGPPNYKEQVTVLTSADEAARQLDKLRELGKPVSFDFETNMLKPDSDSSYVACCAVSNGVTTISYPWVGEAVKATKRLLFSDVPKYGYNIKFEERFVRKLWGRGVNNWSWDGMQAAHVIDNRHGITSLKFQSFVLFGIEDYNYHIEDYLRSDDGGGNSPNRIKEISEVDLLTYCGMDALLEYLVAKKQMKILGDE